MNFSKKKILVFLILFLLNISKTLSQGQAITDINGSVIKVQSYTEVQGSPYLFNDFLKSSIKFTNGKVINNVAIKYDQIKDEITFVGVNGGEYYFSDPVSEFSLSYINNQTAIDRLFRSGFNSFKNFNHNSFYEVLVDGNIKLLRKNAKIISEIKEYNSATSIKIINENIGYYISKHNEIIQLKKNNIKSLIEALDSNKSTSLLEFSKKENLNIENEEYLKKIIIFYNSINN